MNTCPHCGRPAVSFWQKMVLGPAREVPCPHCRNRVGVAAARAYLSFVPAAILIVWIPYMRSTDAMILAGIAATLVTAVLYWFWVPLVKRSLTLDRTGVTG